MKAFFLTLLLALSSIHTIRAQQDTSALLKEVGIKLKNGSISSVLGDKKYLLLHPETEFREMIKKHASTDVLSIAPDNEPGKK